MSKDNYLVSNFSAGNFSKEDARQKLEKKYAPILEVTNKFTRKSVSFQSSKDNSIYGWLHYKEGFSPELVKSFLNEFDLHNSDWILDPFNGSGTTTLVAKLNNINSVGFDILPTSKISIIAKKNVLNYNIDELKKLVLAVKEIEVPKNYNKEINSINITKYAYPEKNAVFLSYIKKWIENNDFSVLANNLLTLVIINSLEVTSYTSKKGQYLSWDSRSEKVRLTNEKRALKGKPPLRKNIVRKKILDSQKVIVDSLDSIINDIKHLQNKYKSNAAKLDFIQGSSLFELPKLKSNSISGVISSPPYCNRYDYTRTYALELAYLGLTDKEIKLLRQSLLSSTVENKSKISLLKDFYEKNGKLDFFNQTLNTIESNLAYQEILDALKRRNEVGDLNNKGVVRMVKNYFLELGFVFAELERVCESGAHLVFINDNVRYGGEVIPVDFLTSSIAKDLGFKVNKIMCLKQLKGNSSQQMAKYGRVPLRKSITIWEKV